MKIFQIKFSLLSKPVCAKYFNGLALSVLSLYSIQTLHKKLNFELFHNMLWWTLIFMPDGFLASYSEICIVKLYLFDAHILVTQKMRQIQKREISSVAKSTMCED